MTSEMLLEEYERLKVEYKELLDDYTDLNKQLRKANSKNDELKETLQRTAQESFRQISELTEENQNLKDMLEVACDDFDAVMGNERCIACANYNGSVCDYKSPCVWQHRDEALELIFGKEHEDGRSESEP